MARNGAIVARGKGGKGGKMGVNAGINFKYDMDDDYEEPGYTQGVTGNVRSQKDGYHGGFASGKVGGARAVSKHDYLAAEAQGPQGRVGSGVNEDGVMAVCEGNIGEAEAHAGWVGVGVKGPGAGYEFEAGKNGVNLNAGAELAAGKVNMGPVNVGAGVGIKGALRADKDGAGAIIPGVGGLVVAKDGMEIGFGPFSFNVGW